MEKEHELKQMKRNLDESEGAIAQVTLIIFFFRISLRTRLHHPLTSDLFISSTAFRCLKGSSVCGRRRWRS